VVKLAVAISGSSDLKMSASPGFDSRPMHPFARLPATPSFGGGQNASWKFFFLSCLQRCFVFGSTRGRDLRFLSWGGGKIREIAGCGCVRWFYTQAATNKRCNFLLLSTLPLYHTESPKPFGRNVPLTTSMASLAPVMARIS
jgi:hypothetical protein